MNPSCRGSSGAAGVWGSHQPTGLHSDDMGVVRGAGFTANRKKSLSKSISEQRHMEDAREMSVTCSPFWQRYQLKREQRDFS